MYQVRAYRNLNKWNMHSDLDSGLTLNEALHVIKCNLKYCGYEECDLIYNGKLITSFR